MGLSDAAPVTTVGSRYVPPVSASTRRPPTRSDAPSATALVDKWAHLGVRKQRIGRKPPGRRLDDPLNDPVGDVGMNN
jgi:hypothetical protein